MSPIGGHHSTPGHSDEWLTPPQIIEALGPFDLDPCVSPDMPWRTARTMFAKGRTDGLAVPWHGRVWCNPPYGAATAAWLRRVAIHGNGIALVFARTETMAWHTWVWPRCSGVLFLNGRLNFHEPDGQRAERNAGGPSALVAYGRTNEAALAESGLAGALVGRARCVLGAKGTDLGVTPVVI